MLNLIPLSSTQKYIWVDQNLSPQSGKYIIGGYCRINGVLNYSIFKQAVTLFVSEQELFGLCLVDTVNGPMWKQSQKEYEGVAFIDLSERVDGEKGFLDYIKNDFVIPFSVSTESLFKFEIIKLDESRWIWYAKVHHILSDGWGISLLFQRVSELYNSLTKLDKLNIQERKFSNFIYNDIEYLKSQSYSEDRDYWLNKYRYNSQVLFPLKPGDNENKKGKIFSLNISSHSYISFKNICKKNNVTSFQAILGINSLLFCQGTDRDGISIAVPLLNRSNRYFKETMGPFMNILPVRIETDHALTLLDLIKGVKKELLQTYRHQKFQLGHLLKELNLQSGSKGIYDLRVSFEQHNYNALFRDCACEIVAMSNEEEEDPLSIHIMEYQDGKDVEVRFDYREEYLQEWEVKAIAERFCLLLESFEDNLLKKVNEVNLFLPGEKELVTTTFQGEEEERSIHSLVDLLQDSFKRYPDNVAIIQGTEVITYRELDERSGLFSTNLNNRNIGKGNLVALHIPRSAELIVSMIGTLRAGASYMPVDPSYPTSRVAYMLDDSRCDAVVTNQDLAIDSSAAIISFEELQDGFPAQADYVTFEPEDQAYIIYTSGSTGKPKGVSVSHASVADYVLTFSEYFKVSSEDVVLHQASPSFDTSIEEMFPVLVSGGKMIIQEDAKDLESLEQNLYKHNITLLSVSPNVVSYLNEKDNIPQSLRVLISGGDVLKPSYVDRLYTKTHIYNTYGPTESTVCASYYPVETLTDPLPIGKPIKNRRIYILSQDKALVPVGVYGELYLGGKGIAREYLNRVSLTAERFIDDPFENKGKLYRTGDKGRWLPDGTIEFAGRTDDQIKIRGYRIEPGEVEAALKNIKVVQDGVVMARTSHSGGQSLVAYFIPAIQNQVDSEDLKGEMKQVLPAHMVPDIFIQIEAFPLTAQGKTDKKALPDPFTNRQASESEVPVTETEIELANIWKEHLQIVNISREDNFFELGGHSILANQLLALIRTRFSIEISLKNFFENPRLLQLADFIDNAEKGELRLEKAPEGARIPLSFAQERLWFLYQLNPDNMSYNVPRVIQMKGRVRHDILEATYTEIVRRHEVLRSAFITIDGVPYMEVKAPYHFDIPEFDLKSFSKEEQDNWIHQFVLGEGRKLFDLESGRLIRVQLLHLSNDESLMVFCEHHLVHDGWTQGVLLNEFIDIYTALAQEQEHGLAEPELQYGDFTYWQKNHLQGKVLEDHLSYWKEKLQGVNPVPDLPYDFPRPPAISGMGDVVELELDEELASAIRAYSKRKGNTLFITMVAAFKCLLHHYTNQEDICIGTWLANRKLKQTEGMLGMIINTLPLRTLFSKQDSFDTFLDRVKNSCVEMYDHEDTPFGKIVEVVNPVRSLSYNPLFQVNFSFMDTPSRRMNLPELDLELLESHNRSAKFDINVVVVTPQEQLRGSGDAAAATIQIEWEFNSDIFSRPTMHQMLSHYKALLSYIVAQDKTPIADIPLLAEDEMLAEVDRYNPAPSAYPAKSINSLITEIMERHANEPALISCDIRLTYRELQQEVNKAATYLNKHLGLKPGERVAVVMDRSANMLISLLAIMKNGSAYVPVDPAFPSDRITYILSDCNAKFVVCDDAYVTASGEVEYHPYSEIQQAESYSETQDFSHAEGIAYAIYTSGSTGQPKGVCIKHSSVVNLLDSIIKTTGFKAGHSLLSVTTFSFDISVLEFFVPLISGGCLILPSSGIVKDPFMLSESLEQYRPDMMQATPSTWKMLLEAGWEGAQETLVALCGGEALSRSLADQLSGKVAALWNVYGPTETTIWSMAKRIESGKELITIGHPLHNNRVFILDDQLKVVPKGVTGELYIGGEGLAEGYLNRPELTKERFITFPQTGERIYKTGDLAKRLANGEVQFIGRADNQVKIRGHRIELGEIAYNLRQLSGCETVVIARKDLTDNNILVAFLEGADEEIISSSRTGLQNILPDYMVPESFNAIDELPLTPNGKVDIRALEKVEITGEYSVSEVYVAPVTGTEIFLEEVFASLLRREKVGTDQNFFKMGGHSLMAARVISRIYKEKGVKLLLRSLFLYPTIAELAEHIDSLKHDITENIRYASEAALYPCSPSQRRMWVMEQMNTDNSGYNLPSLYELKGDVDENRLLSAFSYLVNRHESLRTVFIDQKGEPFQKILSSLPLAKYYQSVSAATEEQAIEIGRQRFSEPYDLTTGPLFRVLFIRTGSVAYMAIDMHHIISDGWSLSLIIRDVLHYYKQGEEQPELSIQYKDYSVWQAAKVHKGDLDAGLSYWTKQLGGILPVMELPYDAPRPALMTNKGAALTHHFGKALSEKLEALSQAKGTSLYMVLMALTKSVMYRYSEQNDMIIGTPVAGRDHAQTEDIVGLFVNTLAIRSRFDGNTAFDDLLLQVRKLVLEGYDHQEYPFDLLLDKLEVTRDPSRNPVFDVMMSYQKDHGIQEGELSKGITVRPVKLPVETSKFDLSFTFRSVAGEVSCEVEYNTDLFNSKTAGDIMLHLTLLAEAFCQDTTLRIGQPELVQVADLPPALKPPVIPELRNVNFSGYYERFIHAVARFGDRPAVDDKGEILTFAQLKDKVEELASHLHTQYGISKGDVVGVLLSRGSDLLVSALACFRLGAVYTPIDTNYPAERIGLIISDSGLSLMITRREYDHLVSSKVTNRLQLDHTASAGNRSDLPEVTFGPDDILYLIYTSGSTGVPKGVAVRQEGLLNLCEWHADNFRMDENSVSTMLASIGFDASVWEFMPALITGCCLIPVSDQDRIETSALKAIIRSKKVTHAFMPPLLCEQFMATSADFDHKLIIYAGGDVLQNVTSNAGITIYNNYGPTEFTIISTSYRVPEHLVKEIPIGKPLKNNLVYILNIFGNLQPRGVKGELFCSGVNITAGYWKNEALTGERFTSDPFYSDRTMYRTGDLGIWDADGNIYFRGRADHQLKVRGYRIEPGEINHHILQHPAIEQSHVILHKKDSREPLLAAFIIYKEEAVDSTELKSYLRNFVPDYMVPSAFVRLDSFPVNSSGKIDADVLQQMDLHIEDNTRPYRAPETEMEVTVAGMFAEYLQTDQIGRDDDYFELGGTSITGIKITHSINERFNLNLKVNSLFGTRTVKDLAAEIEAHLLVRDDNELLEEDEVTEIKL
ncbi:amino acid adenylation domain-containing protein [Roseivirga sp. BDSF3-8]|uniref:non-ribosomal peptide synthetase n=1 Tax=Roseivirga sp. BDSF3-8 TaxID=3241598 RepID=UPI00353218A2